MKIDLPDSTTHGPWSMHSDGWHGFREGGIGGSSCGSVMGVNQFQSPYDTWQAMVGLVPKFQGNEYTRRGTEREPFIREMAPKLLKDVYKMDSSVFDVGDYSYRSKEHDFMICNLDGVIESEGNQFGLEIKTAKKSKKRFWKGDKVPETYWYQMQHCMITTGLRTFFAICEFDDGDISVRRVDFAPFKMIEIVETERVFWSMVKSKFWKEDWLREVKNATQERFIRQGDF